MSFPKALDTGSNRQAATRMGAENDLSRFLDLLRLLLNRRIGMVPGNYDVSIILTIQDRDMKQNHFFVMRLENR